MAELNLEKEKIVCTLFGCTIGDVQDIEGEQEIDVFNKEKQTDGVIHVHQLPNGMYMNQVVIDRYHDDVYFNGFVTDFWHIYNYGRNRGYKVCLNLYGLPSYRLTAEKDDEFIGFGLFDFSGGTSKKDKEDRKKEKKFCEYTRNGFFLHYKLGDREEKLIFSNMEKDANHLDTFYAHLVQEKGIKVACREHREDAETIAKNDVNGVAFFKKFRERLNEIFPDSSDVLSLFISNEEIEKYGLSIYLEPKKEKSLDSGNRKRKKKD